MPQQVPDVGADAEIVQLARVDGDAHVSDISTAWRPLVRRPVSAQIERGGAAPSADGASRRTRAGCAGRRRSSRPAPSARERPRRWTISAAGVNRIRRPRARIAAQKSTSSVYRKKRSSSRPDGLGVGRRTSRQAPLTQSTNCSRPRRASTHVDDCGHPRAYSAPRTSAAAPRAARSSRRTTARPPLVVHQPRPGRRRVGYGEQRARPERSIAPGGTIVSLFSSRISSPVVARMPALLAARSRRSRPARSADTAASRARRPRRCRRWTRCRRR